MLMEKEQKGFSNDAVFVAPLFQRSDEQFKRKSSRSSDEYLSSKRRRFGFCREEEHNEEFANDAVLTDLRLNISEEPIRRRFVDDEDDSNVMLKSGQRSIRQRFGCVEGLSLSSSEKATRRIADTETEEEDEYAKDAVFYKPWLDNKDPSSSSPSQEEYIALLLLHLSRGTQTQTLEKTQTQKNVKKQKKTRSQENKTQTRVETETQTPEETQTQAQTLFQVETQTQVVAQSQVQTLPQAETQQTQSLVETQPHKQVLQTPQSQPQLQTQTPLKLDSYKCSVCERVFHTYQALGGHKASHRLQTPQPLLENANAEKTRTKLLTPSGKLHECSICHMVFPTGQALGGHKRRHYEGVLGGGGKSGGDNKSSLSSSNGSVVSDTKQKLPKLIDLNKTPSPETCVDGDGDDVAEEVESGVVTEKRP
ncbi:unnamed protein product [Cochlearia groenlandica]